MNEKSHQSPGTSEPVTGEPKSGPPRRRTVNPRPRITIPRSLGETRGPEPAAPLSEVRLTVGTIGGTHGIRGELKMKVLTDQPDHLRTIKQVFLGASDQTTELEAIRFQGESSVIKLAGIDTPEAAKALGGLAVRIAGSDAKPLAEDEYFLFQLIGLRAESETGDEIGDVVDLMETGAHDVLVIRPTLGGDDLLIPNHPEYVIATEPVRGRIVVRVPVYHN